MGEHNGHRARLRKLFLEQGMDVLQDEQVLEILLFYALPRRDTNDLANKLLRHFGTIAAVLEAPLSELKAVAGIGDNAAVLLRLITPLARRYLVSRTEVGQVLLTTEACGAYLVPYFFGVTEEVIYILCLDAKCKVLTCRRLQEGNVNSVGFSIRRAAEAALSCNASSVILAHNHTSGIALPSNADVNTTREIKKALKPLGILLADHIVVADGDFVSMADNGFLDDDEEKKHDRDETAAAPENGPQ